MVALCQYLGGKRTDSFMLKKIKKTKTKKNKNKKHTLSHMHASPLHSECDYGRRLSP